MMSSVSGRMPASHCEAYTALDWLCQNITAFGLFPKTKFLIAIASGSENGLVPALTVLSRHILSGCHLQSKLRLRSTSCALNRPGVVDIPLGTSALVNRPTLPMTLYTPS